MLREPSHTTSRRVVTPVGSTQTITSEPTEEGVVLGTLGYIAPEHLFEGINDARSDQFGFAVTMYVALYGRHPFAHDDFSTYVEALRGRPERPPSAVPRWIHAILLRGMRSEPGERFATMAEMLDALERDPAQRRRWAALGAALAGVLAVSGAWSAHHHAELRARCAAGDAIIASTWNAASQKHVRESLEQAGATYGATVAERVIAKLGDYGHDWSAAYRTVNEATLLRAQQSPALLEQRLGCLERAREEYEALVELLATADKGIAEHALDASYGLPLAGSCVTMEASRIAPPPAAPALRARVRAAERTLSRANVLSKAGRDRAALDLIDRTLVDVRTIPYRSVEAELLLVAAVCKQQTGDNRGALDSFHDAFAAAEAASDDATAARAASNISFVLSGWLWKPREGERWIDIASTIAARAGHDDALETDILHNRIVEMMELGRLQEAVELLDKEIPALERIYGERSFRLAAEYVNKGVAYIFWGKPELAAPPIRRGIELFQNIGGPDNPHLDLYYANLGAVLMLSRDFDEAREALLRGIAVQGDLPPGSVTEMLFGNLANLELEAERPAAALAYVQNGIDVATAIGEAGERFMTLLLYVRGMVRAQRGDAAGALDDCGRVLSMQDAHGEIKAGEPYSTDALRCIAEAELSLNRLGPAIEHLERSVALDRRQDRADLPRARFTLARALRIARRDPERAESLARSARTELAEVPRLDKEVAAIDAWLAPR
jgi:tetratricopeptide (TPR) repeat protein